MSTTTDGYSDAELAFSWRIAIEKGFDDTSLAGEIARQDPSIPIFLSFKLPLLTPIQLSLLPFSMATPTAVVPCLLE